MSQAAKNDSHVLDSKAYLATGMLSAAAMLQPVEVAGSSHQKETLPAPTKSTGVDYLRITLITFPAIKFIHSLAMPYTSIKCSSGSVDHVPGRLNAMPFLIERPGIAQRNMGNYVYADAYRSNNVNLSRPPQI